MASPTIRVDDDVLQWFKAQGRGHLSRMNAVLRAYMLSRAKERT
ncbi:MAG: BrnA antitoxin family protein [Hyphomonadaceae bacterium]|nr:BrnA antitoxin family protein [Aquidulcibacter sp.]MCZ8208866.1 BrnA antitoxin family protein [Aquidulcibacter sp.]